MKGGESTIWLFGVDNPNDPISGAISRVAWMGTPQGAGYVALFGSSGEVAIGDGSMVSAIDGDVETGLNVRSATYALRYDSADPTLLLNVSLANIGEFIDLSAPQNARALLTNSAVYGYDASADDGSMSAAFVDVAVATFPAALPALGTLSAVYGFAGGVNAPVRIHATDAVNAQTTDATNALQVQQPGEWSITHAPAANTTATATRASAGAGNVNILRSISADLIGVGAIAAPILVVVRDGASGVGPVLWQRRLFAPAAGSKDSVDVAGLNIVGSEDTAMTVEFVAGPGATNFETVSATGVQATQ